MSEDRDKKIKACFDLFRLDDRASKRELELAYEVLTKGKNDLQLRAYRLAFEYLMTDFYKAVDVKTENDLPPMSLQEFEDESRICINSAPQPVRDAIIYAQEQGLRLSNSATLAWATQNINLPLLFKAIMNSCHKILGIKFWNVASINKILKTCILNPLEYRTCTFELSTDNIIQIEEVQKFVKGMQELYKEDTFLCPKFDIRNTENGTMALVVVEKDLREHLLEMLQGKAMQSGLILNLVTPED